MCVRERDGEISIAFNNDYKTERVSFLKTINVALEEAKSVNDDTF